VTAEERLGFEENTPRLTVRVGGGGLVDALAIDAPPHAGRTDEDQPGVAGDGIEETTQAVDVDLAIAASGGAIESDRPDDGVDLGERGQGEGSGNVGDDRLHAGCRQPGEA
jgi:hypothetical protein